MLWEGIVYSPQLCVYSLYYPQLSRFGFHFRKYSALTVQMCWSSSLMILAIQSRFQGGIDAAHRPTGQRRIDLHHSITAAAGPTRASIMNTVIR